MKTVKAEIFPGYWELKENDVWNVPDEDMYFKMKHTPFPFALVKSITGLVIDMDGTIYGIRKGNKCTEDGTTLSCWVYIGGKKYSAFTSSRLFKKGNKFVDVAVLIIKNIKKEE